uniref:Uncharacterized protein n=1 Tax=Micrurus lemniscatus lemniscatus TaxID=129467 RepID=A0A2D4HJP7_MICLE
MMRGSFYENILSCSSCTTNNFRKKCQLAPNRIKKKSLKVQDRNVVPVPNMSCLIHSSSEIHNPQQWRGGIYSLALANSRNPALLADNLSRIGKLIVKAVQAG